MYVLQYKLYIVSFLSSARRCSWQSTWPFIKMVAQLGLRTHGGMLSHISQPERTFEFSKAFIYIQRKPGSAIKSEKQILQFR